MMLLLAGVAGCLVNTDLHDELARDLAANASDADDSASNPSDCEPSPEICNEVDDDCDDQIDDQDPDLTAATFYLDADRDGFGDVLEPRTACNRPEDTVIDATDCDDSDETSFPGGTEICGDAVDQDCNGVLLTCFVGGTRFLTDVAIARQLSSETFDSMASAGDVDGDGRPDLMIGVANDSGFGSHHAGAVHLVHGDLVGDQQIESAAFATIRGTSVDGGLGFDVAAAGDVDGDTFADILVAGGELQTQNGVVLLFRGPLSGDVPDTLADARFESGRQFVGLWVGGEGDTNDDGVPDLLIGEGAGTVYVVSGSHRGTNDLSEVAGLAIHGQNFSATRAAMAGDVDGDGRTDVIVGSPQGSDASSPLARPGLAYLVIGGGAGDLDLVADADARWVGESDTAYAGESVAGAGDVDGDGLDDLLVGAYQEQAGGFDAGAAYVVSGMVRDANSLADARARLIGETFADRVGDSVMGGGDVDGDGTADVLVGAPGRDEGGASAGATYLFLGPLDGTETLADADATLHGSTDEQSGAGVDVGDFDADDRSDMVIRGNPFPGGVVFIVPGSSL